MSLVRIVLRRSPAGWAALAGLVAADVGATVAIHGAVPVLPVALGLDLAVQALVLPAVIWLLRWLVILVWPSMEAAAVEVACGGRAVGTAVAVRRRLVVTTAEAVRRALPSLPGESGVPGRGAQVCLLCPGTPGVPGGPTEVWATVVLWGPARPGLRCPDLAVLRTTTRLPRGVPHLRLAPTSHRGPATLLLPGADSADAGERRVTVAGGQMRTTPDLVDDTRVSGAPLVVTLHSPGGPGTDGARIVGLAAPTPPGPDHEDSPGGDVEVPDPAVARPSRSRASAAAVRDLPSVPLVEPADLRAAVGEVTRRQVLRVGAAALGVAAAGAAPAIIDGLWGGMEGLGWRSLFEDRTVAAYLKKRGHRVGDVAQQSGVRTLDLPDAVLADHDFITCPNQLLANEVQRRVDRRRRTSTPTAQYRICASELVVLTRRRLLPTLVRAGLLVQHESESDPRFDLLAYARGFATDWGQLDPEARSMARGLRVRCSDPLRAGGGELALIMMAKVQDLILKADPTLPTRVREPAWLWRNGGPLYGLGPSSTLDLNSTLVDTEDAMILTYEHEAITLWHSPPEYLRRDELAMLRTSPFLRFDQFLVGISEHGHELGRLFRDDPTFAKLLYQNLHLRAGTLGRRIDQDFRTGDLASLLPDLRDLLPPGGRTTDPATFLPLPMAREMQDLVDLLKRDHK